VTGVVGLTVVLGLLTAALPWWWTGRPARLHAVTVPPRPRADAMPEAIGLVDVVVVLGLLDAAIASGAGLPRALTAVGRTIGGDDGRGLVSASAALVMGADWETAWSVVPERLTPVARCLSATWSSGAAPGPALRAASEHLQRERRTTAREAAGRLGVRLVLPLGLCFLPAFVLIGLVPVMVSVGAEVIR
jgi:pilus assembly protein TadC